MNIQPCLIRAGLLVMLTILQVHALADVVRIAVPPTSGFLPLFIAKERGLFSKRNLDVEIVPVGNSAAAVTSVIAKSAELAAPTASSILQAVESGAPLRIVAGTEVLPSAVKVAVMAKGASAIRSGKDLAGKRVGVPGINGLIDVLFRRWVMETGGDVNAIKIVETPFPQMADMLRGGLVDAVAAADPFVSRIAASGGELKADLTTGLPAQTVTTLYVARADWIAAMPQFAGAFRAALTEAIAVIQANPEAAREALGRFTRLPAPIVAALPMPNLDANVKADQIAFWISLSKKQGLIKSEPEAASLLVP